MGVRARLPGIKQQHGLVHVGPGNWSCTCGVFLASNRDAACRAIHPHRDDIPFDEWLSEFVDVGDCWVWTGRLDDAGYGRTPNSVQAYRFVYRILVGPIPTGMTLDHVCRDKRCVNPDHMEIVTTGENALRGSGPAAMNKRKTHCNKGHLFTPESTYVERLTGKRHCTPCTRIRQRRAPVVLGERQENT